MLIDVSQVSLATTILGHPIALPIMVAPMASQRMAHPDGELATARAAAAAGTIMIVSTSTMVPIEEIGAVPGGNFWFQLYPWTDFEATVAMIDRADRRRRQGDLHDDRCHQPRRPEAAPARRHARARMGLSYPMYGPEAVSLDKFDWAFVDRLQARLSVPLVLKGVLHPDDARLAIDAGAKAIVV